MKFLIFIQAMLFTILGIQINMLPKLPALFIALGCVLVMDLVTGIIKAKLNNVLRTSKAMRSSVTKFIQYTTAIVLSVGLQFLLKEFDQTSQEYANYLCRGLVLFIVMIEVFSCCENIYDVDKTSTFSKYVVTPVLKIMSFGFKHNPLADAAKEATKIEKNETDK